MSDRSAWSRIEAEAREAFRGAGRFPLRAYSEFMPPPYIGLKPYEPNLAAASATSRVSDGNALEIDEYEQAFELAPGLGRIATRIVATLDKLLRGEAHALPSTFLDGNPAWPAALADAAAQGRFAKHAPLTLALPLALSRTQDDLGNVRWTLFGGSHDGPSAPFWRSFDDAAGLARFDRYVTWATGAEPAATRILAEASEVPAALRSRLVTEDVKLAGLRALVTFWPFASLPAAVRDAWLAGSLALVPCPASLIFFEHPRYRQLAQQLPQAMQIPLQLLFPRVEASCAIRIPQSGWLDEHDPSQRDAQGRQLVARVQRTHRWQRVHRDERDTLAHGDGKFTDPVTVALFSTNPDELGLYGKPMARNAQVWTGEYRLLLDGPHADRTQLEHAARITDAGGRFGYRFVYPPMRGGARELFWHLPLCARGTGSSDAEVFTGDAPAGYVSADRAGAQRLTLTVRLLARPDHRAAATLFAHDPGRKRFTTSHNVRKLLEHHELLGAPLEPRLARALLRAGKTTTLEEWLAGLPALASDRAEGERLTAALRACVGPTGDAGEPLTLAHSGSRLFELHLWRTIASLAEGEYQQKANADGIAVNEGKHGGPAAKAAGVHVAERRDLERLGDHLHAQYRALIERHGLSGRAEVVDHVFRWDTDFTFPWMEGWAKNAGAPAERNVVCMIPGRNRAEAVVMGDHYDTAYMEDVYDAERGGDGLRAPASGADDNHSATTALLAAADALMVLAKAGRLERDVWLVHLTGEEFPSDCLGARALVQQLVERRLTFTTEHAERRDVSGVRVAGAYILDMVGHNSDRDRDVFQIASGEGAGSAALAARAHRANLRWNRVAEALNRSPERRDAGRAQRMPDGRQPPPLFAHLPLAGEVRVEWEPRSALYNTDGQIFSDAGIPVVLFMENYDINRTGYHDTHDTMANIDLDYCAALTAIAIESVADAACARSS